MPAWTGAAGWGLVMGMSTLLALVLGLAGCASLAPPYERPAPPVPQTYATTTSAGMTAAPAIASRDYFADERLQSLIEQAPANSRDLRSAVLRVDEARASLSASSVPAASRGGESHAI